MESVVGITAHLVNLATKMVSVFALTQTCLLMVQECVPVLWARSGKVKVEIVYVLAQETRLMSMENVIARLARSSLIITKFAYASWVYFPTKMENARVHLDNL